MRKGFLNWASVPLVIDIDTAAIITGYHPVYLRKLAREGSFPAKQKSKKSKWFIGKDELHAWLTDQALSA